MWCWRARTRRCWSPRPRTLDGTQFRRLLGSWRQVVDPDGRLADADRAYTRRRLTLTPCYDGSVAVNGRLDAEGGATVIAALRALADADRVPGELRGASEARADALVGLCRQALDGGLPACDGERPHLDVTVSWAWLAGHTDPDGACALPDVGPIPAQTARRLACDAGVSRIVTDPAGLPLDIGRRAATPTAGQRRALKHRDRGCRFPGCTRRRRLHAHHVRFWARDTGPTNLDNLVLLCWRCHRLVHEGGWTLTYHPATNTTRATSPTGLTLHGPAPPPTG